MTVSRAKTIASRWALDQARDGESIRAADFIGTATRLDGDRELPAESDLDVSFVVDDGAVDGVGHRRELADGVSTDASSVGVSELADSGAVLADYIHGATFSVPCLIFDRTGLLEPLNARGRGRRVLQGAAREADLMAPSRRRQ